MTRTRTNIGWGLALGLVCLLVDQLSKEWALASLSSERIDILGSAFGLKLIHNPGAAFSVGEGSTWIFTTFALAVVVALPVFIGRTGSRVWALGLGAVWGGAAGNLLDRFLRAPGGGRGHVVDFLAYGDFFVGNVADIILCLAAVFLVVISMRGVTFSQENRDTELNDGDEKGGKAQTEAQTETEIPMSKRGSVGEQTGAHTHIRKDTESTCD